VAVAEYEMWSIATARALQKSGLVFGGAPSKTELRASVHRHIITEAREIAEAEMEEAHQEKIREEDEKRRKDAEEEKKAEESVTG
jgi:hypothetical protein